MGHADLGTGWVWDMRTTSVLVLLFLFFGLMALRQAIPRPDRAAYFVSILALVGVINIPIIKYSVDWLQRYTSRRVSRWLANLQ
ncbi:MAG: hypothetical protein Ct9H300mP8_06020 [Gammaproteobacteria bacterium]|nr:MAG: hypothetical protein Ct9H300mP8_06020 [Gammaproteobacteria bacterium]